MLQLNRYCSVTDTPCFVNMPNLDPQWVQGLFTQIRVQQGEVVYNQGDPADKLYIVKTGILINVFDGDLRRFIVSYQRLGDVIGETEVLYPHSVRFVTLIALYDTILWGIGKDKLELLLGRYPELYRRFFAVVGDRLVRAGRKLAYLSLMDAKTRIIRLGLDALKDRRSQGNTSMQWHITQQSIADHLGLTRESVARVLAELEHQGFIKTSRSTIEVLDVEAIKKQVHFHDDTMLIHT